MAAFKGVVEVLGMDKAMAIPPARVNSAGDLLNFGETADAVVAQLELLEAMEQQGIVEEVPDVNELVKQLLINAGVPNSVMINLRGEIKRRKAQNER